MKLPRKILGPVLATLIALPPGAAAQTVRLTLEAPVGVPGLVGQAPLALSAPALSAPGLAPLSASLPVLPAPAIAPTVVGAAVPAALAPIVPAAARATEPYGEGVSLPLAVGKGPPSTPDAPKVSVEESKAAADARFDGAAAKDPAAEVAGFASPDAPAPLALPDIDRRLQGLGRVPAPRPWLEKGKVLLGYGGLTASAVSLHAPFDSTSLVRLGLGAFLGLAMAPVLAIFMAAAQSVRSVSPAAVPPAAPSANDAAKALAQAETPKPSAASMELIARLAVEAKVPAPARVNIMGGDKVQAQVGGGDDRNPGYEIRFTKAFESLRPDVQEAIIRHEYAHRRHHDGVWTMVSLVLTTVPAMVALLGAADKPDAFGWLAGAIAATAILMLPTSMRHSEYLADQYAASKPEGAAPLARFFIEDSKDPARAASALSGREFSTLSGWRRRAVMLWDSLKTLFAAHPSHDRRIARLARLAAKEKSR